MIEIVNKYTNDNTNDKITQLIRISDELKDDTENKKFIPNIETLFEEPLIQIIHEDEDIELDELEIRKVHPTSDDVHNNE